ncbi:MAG TPA: TolC family protein, partial [Bacillota bacterium]|nr:TolC family protein [Bacillota bacterium]
MCARILLGLVLCAAATASAQTALAPTNTRPVSLRECIDLALEHNLDLQIEHLTTDIARYSLQSSYGAYVPTFSFRARHDYVSQPGDFDPQKFNPDFPYELKTDSFGPTLAGRLPWGLDYDLSAIAREDNAKTDFRGDPGDARNFPGGIRQTNNYYSNARITLQQHLLKDFWIDPYRETLVIRRKQLKMSEQALRFQIMKTVLAIEVSYYDLIAAREKIRVEEKALELRQQLLAETRRRVQVGDLPPLDSEQAETQVQNTLTALAAAREAFTTQQNGVKRLLTDNFKQWVDTDLQPADPLVALPAQVNRSASFQSALPNRPDLMEARLAVEKSDVVVKFSRNQLFPSLDLIGRYGGQGVNDDPGSAVNDTFSFRNPEYFYGAVVSFPLSNVAERNNYRASKAAKQVAQLQLKKAEEEILVQVADLVNRVQSRYSQVDST